MRKLALFLGFLLFLARPMWCAPLPTNREHSAFVTALARDARGALWVGGENGGAARLDGEKWTRFEGEDGPGDEISALAGDRLGRMWAGTFDAGLWVYNGAAWQHFGVLDGPLGERIWKITTSPLDGDIWIAHNAGLSRYSLAQQKWTHFTPATGFPALDVSSLAFDARGTLWVGTACDGLLVGAPGDNYANWKRIEGESRLPSAPFGAGLPSNLINDVLCTPDGGVWVATTRGLARSGDGGASFEWLRGRDWKAKLAGLQNPVAATGEFDGDLLLDDWVSALAADDAGNVWIATRGGYEVRRENDWQLAFRVGATPNPDARPISCLAPLENGLAALGTYGAGVLESEKFARMGVSRRENAVEAEISAVALFPRAASAPTNDEMRLAREQIENLGAKTEDPATITLLEDDWTTRGDWLGRYGRHYAQLFGILSPSDYFWGAGESRVESDWHFGAHHNDPDGARYWIHWLYSSDPRVLEMPPAYARSRLMRDPDKKPAEMRREAEINDNGGAYPVTFDGPHLRGALKIPAGRFVLSLYNFNKDAHDGGNWKRDYEVSIRPHDPKLPLSDTSDFQNAPELSLARMRAFWNSVYTRFAVQGPCEITVGIERNASLNTMVSGLFLDPIDEQSAPYFGFPGGINAPETTSAAPKMENEADRLWNALETLRERDFGAWSRNSRLGYALLARFDAANPHAGPEAQKRRGTAFRALNLLANWEETQRQRGFVAARDLEKAIRWDGKTSSGGREPELMAQLVTARAGLAWREKYVAAAPATLARENEPIWSAPRRESSSALRFFALRVRELARKKDVAALIRLEKRARRWPPASWQRAEALFELQLALTMDFKGHETRSGALKRRLAAELSEDSVPLEPLKKWLVFSGTFPFDNEGDSLAEQNATRTQWTRRALQFWKCALANQGEMGAANNPLAPLDLKSRRSAPAVLQFESFGSEADRARYQNALQNNPQQARRWREARQWEALLDATRATLPLLLEVLWTSGAYDLPTLQGALDEVPGEAQTKAKILDLVLAAMNLTIEGAPLKANP